MMNEESSAALAVLQLLLRSSQVALPLYFILYQPTVGLEGAGGEGGGGRWLLE